MQTITNNKTSNYKLYVLTDVIENEKKGNPIRLPDEEAVELNYAYAVNHSPLRFREVQ